MTDNPVRKGCGLQQPAWLGSLLLPKEEAQQLRVMLRRG